MKLIILISSFLFATSLSATPDGTCTTNDIQENIIELISSQEPFTDFDLEGIVTIQFTVDENHVLHITGINTGNKLLANHVMETLKNKVIDCDCVVVGAVYTIKMQYVQYS